MRNEAFKKVISTKSLQNTSRGRSNLSQMFFKIGALNNFAIFSGLDSLFNKVSCLEACDFIKKRLQHSYFPMNMAEFLRTAFFKEHFWWLLLKRSYWAPPQVFSIFMNVHEFSNFLLWEVYPSVVIHEQCIFIINDQTGSERNNVQRLLKIDWTEIYFNNLTSIACSYR